MPIWDPKNVTSRANLCVLSPPSQVKYHEDFEKNIKGTKIQVAEDPELNRTKQLTKVVSDIEYRGHRDQAQEMEQRRSQVNQRKARLSLDRISHVTLVHAVS